MWRESYRRGCVKYFVKSRLKSTSTVASVRMAVRMTAKSLGLSAWHLLQITACIGQSRKAWVPHALKLADSVGTIAGVLHIPNRHYRPKDVAC
jgi:hypothetical protein